MDKSNLDIFVLDAGAYSFRAGRAEDFPNEAQTPYTVLPSVVRPVGTDDADSTQTNVEKVCSIVAQPTFARGSTAAHRARSFI
jgi:hypothetical protein